MLKQQQQEKELAERREQEMQEEARQKEELVRLQQLEACRRKQEEELRRVEVEKQRALELQRKEKELREKLLCNLIKKSTEKSTAGADLGGPPTKEAAPDLSDMMLGVLGRVNGVKKDDGKELQKSRSVHPAALVKIKSKERRGADNKKELVRSVHSGDRGDHGSSRSRERRRRSQSSSRLRRSSSRRRRSHRRSESRHRGRRCSSSSRSSSRDRSLSHRGRSYSRGRSQRQSHRRYSRKRSKSHRSHSHHRRRYHRYSNSRDRSHSRGRWRLQSHWLMFCLRRSYSSPQTQRERFSAQPDLQNMELIFTGKPNHFHLIPSVCCSHGCGLTVSVREFVIAVLFHFLSVDELFYIRGIIHPFRNSTSGFIRFNV